MSAEPTPGVTISEATEVSPELIRAFERLIPQLSSSSPPPGAGALAEMVASPASVLLVAHDGTGSIVGSLTLAVFRVPTGLRAWIEDVVVDESARGAGAGEALVVAAIRRADAVGARTVDLTSRPSREAANRLYRRLGFETRSTNVYRWSAGPEGATAAADGAGGGEAAPS
jgi:ribosomal protein S18 acetylase RimI-like enzyme